MKKNVGTIDRFVRLILAIVLFSLFFLLEGNMRYIGAVGFIPLVTALVSNCPLYSIFGISSCQVKQTS